MQLGSTRNKDELRYYSRNGIFPKTETSGLRYSFSYLFAFFFLRNLP